jgi:hypothetical protein
MAMTTEEYGFVVYPSNVNPDYKNLSTKHPIFGKPLSYEVHKDYIRFFTPTALYNGRILRPFMKTSVFSIQIKAPELANGRYLDYEENEDEVIVHTKDYSNEWKQL